MWYNIFTMENKLKIAVITGASSGIGKKFCELLPKHFSFDEVWVIARNKERLEGLKNILPYKIRVIPLDLSKEESYAYFENALKETNPEIGLLINASGFGKFELSTNIPLSESLNMIDLNCKAIVATCNIALGYMKEGGKIINVASVAAFQPIPYINVYGATKSFVLSYTRALNSELKSRKIQATAVCPFWTKTEFFNRSIDKEKDTVVKKYVVMYTPEQIVSQAWRDMKKGKEVSMYGFTARTQTLLAKLLPHSFVMSYWMNQQKLK